MEKISLYSEKLEVVYGKSLDVDRCFNFKNNFLKREGISTFFSKLRDRIIRNKGEKGRGNIFSEKLNQSRIALDRL